MDHNDHVRLLRDGIPSHGGIWADLGSGTGAFTLALAELIGPTGVIHSVDRNKHSLRQQERRMEKMFGEIHVNYHVADFTAQIDLPLLDGIVMANSLHFQRDQERTASHIYGYLKPGGRLLLVEYNVKRGNYAVPYPVPFERWVHLAEKAGFNETSLLARRPSRFLREIYSACSIV